MKFVWITIAVKEMEASLYFYNQLLGLAVQSSYPIGDGGQIAFVGEAGQPQIELIYQPGASCAQSQGISVGIQVEDLDACCETVTKAGFPVVRGPVSPNPGMRFSFILDPNGVEVQLVEQSR